MDKLITNLDTNLGPVLREQLDSNFQKIQNGVDGQADSLNKQIETMLGDVPLQDKNEVTQARIDNNGVPYQTLKGRMDVNQVTAETALKEERLTGAEVQSARSDTSGKTYGSLSERMNNQEASLTNSMNAKISQISSVPETFANLAALRSTYPNGKTGLFVTADNGHKYIWANGSWNDAGIYQAVGIADGSIKQQMLMPNAKTGYLIIRDPISIDFTNRIVNIPSVVQVRLGSVRYTVSQQSYTIDLNTTSSGFFFYYDTVTQELSFTDSISLPDTAVLLGWINFEGTPEYHFFTSSVVSNIENKYINTVDRKPYISTGKTLPNIDTATKTLQLNVGFMNVFYPNVVLTIPNRGDVNIDNGSSASFVYYDTVGKNIVSLNSSASNLPPTYLYLGAINWNAPLSNEFNFEVTINGVNLKTTNSKGKRVRISSQNKLIIDRENKTLTLPTTGFLKIDNEDKYDFIIAKNPGAIDISTSVPSASFLFIDTVTYKIVALPTKMEAREGLLYLGYITWDTFSAYLEFDWTLAGHDSLYNGLARRNITFFGDSITWSYNPVKWPTLVAEKLNANFTNAGISGAKYVDDGSTTSAVARATSITNQDAIVVWFGINDFHNSIGLGQVGDGDKTKLNGAVEYVLSTLITNNPFAKIIVMTPMSQHGYNTRPDSITSNNTGKLQSDYVDVIKSAAKRHSIPVLDMFENSGIDAFNATQATTYLRDGLHPNQAGEYRVASKVLKFLN